VTAIFGEGVGYVPCPDAAEVYANEAGTELGRSTYFVPDPCDCNACSSETFSRTFSGGWGLSPFDSLPWRPSSVLLFSVTPGAASFTGDTAYSSISLPLFSGAGTTPFEALVKLTIPAGGAAYVCSVEVTDDTGGFFDVDFSRESGSTLAFDFYGAHGDGSYTVGTTITGQLSGFGGQALYCRLYVDQDLHFKVWVASGSEPGAWTGELALSGTPAGLSGVNFYFGNSNVPVTFASVQLTGYNCGGTRVGTGSPVYSYRVFDKDVNHSADTDYVSVSGYRITTTWFPFPVSAYRTDSEFLASVAPHWERGNGLDPTALYETRHFVVIGSGVGITRAKVDFTPSYGMRGTLDPPPDNVRVGLFTTEPHIGTPGTPVTGALNLVPSFVPYDVVDSGTWFPINAETLVSPMTPDTTNEDLQGPEWGQLQFSNPQNGGADPAYYTTPYPANWGDPFSNNISSIAYEPFIITVEFYPTVAWAPCV
jgi:hypothetical protein